jgi:hypothetical protein
MKLEEAWKAGLPSDFVQWTVNYFTKFHIQLEVLYKTMEDFRTPASLPFSFNI